MDADLLLLYLFIGLFFVSDNIISKHLSKNTDFEATKSAVERLFPLTVLDAAHQTISKWQNYAPTPLHALSAGCEKAGEVYYKDEALRFGLESFKALGGAYAIEQALAEHINAGHDKAAFTVATATDGNHGRSVAWGAHRAGCPAKIFVHRHVSDERVSNIARYGAEIIRIDGNYDDSLAACSEQSLRHGWQVISDTSWPGYTEMPRLVMAGYTVCMREIVQQQDTSPWTHLILPAGVGGFAAAMIAAFVQYNQYLPVIIVVESEHADCLLQSAAAGSVQQLSIEQETVMAGLSCGEPSLLAWDIIHPAVAHYIAITDECVGDAMRQLALNGIIGGECAAAGLAVLNAACHSPRWLEKLQLDGGSKVLLFGSEGATDKASYRRLTGIDPTEVGQ